MRNEQIKLNGGTNAVWSRGVDWNTNELRTVGVFQFKQGYAFCTTDYNKTLERLVRIELKFIHNEVKYKRSYGINDFTSPYCVGDQYPDELLEEFVNEILAGKFVADVEYGLEKKHEQERD